MREKLTGLSIGTSHTALLPESAAFKKSWLQPGNGNQHYLLPTALHTLSLIMLLRCWFTVKTLPPGTHLPIALCR